MSELNGKKLPRWACIYDDGYNILRVIDSLFIKQKTSHHIKSRAGYAEVIGSEISIGVDGKASYATNVSNGGSVLIEGNIIQKGLLSENTAMAICSVCKSGRNESKSIVVRNNKFINSMSRACSFSKKPY